MKVLSVLVLLSIMLFTCMTSGCVSLCGFGIGCPVEYQKIMVSKDPEACKSIRVDCSGYGKEFAPFSDESGCGCVANPGNY